MEEHNKPEFDHYAEEYDALQKENLGVFGKNLSFFSRYKIKLINDLLVCKPAVILEFGCGIGRNIKYLNEFFPNASIDGCDTSSKCLDMAFKQCPIATYNLIENPTDLSVLYPQGVDLILIACVLHHIVDETLQNAWMKSLCSILRPGGHIAIFEHNPYNPLTRHMFNTCTYDKNAKLIKPTQCRTLLENAGIMQIRQLYTLFFIWNNPFWAKVEKALKWLPLGGQYCILAQKDTI